jgi:ankyrin repeat protein
MDDVKKYIEQVNNKDKNGRTPLLVAAKYGRRDVINVLLENTAQVNAKLTNGHTALYTG